MTDPRSLTRRSFLRAGAASAATLAVAPSRAAQGPPSEAIHFAIIGAGSQGRHITSNMLKVPGARLTAICEILPPNQEAARSLAPDARVYTDWNEMLATEADLQAVLIALPEHTHDAATIDALRAGKHVFCEKPMAYSLEQGMAMIAAQRQAGLTLQIGQQRRSNPLYYLAHDLIQNKGLIGNIIRVDAFWDRWSDWKRPLPEGVGDDFAAWGFPTLDHLVNWRLYRAYGHGLMTENGTHQLDATSWLLGGKRPRLVCGIGLTQYPDGRETHDIASAEYDFDDDILVRFSQDFHQGFNNGWEYGELFLGDEGSLRVTEERQLVHYPKGSREGTVLDVADLGTIEFPGIVLDADQLGAIDDFRTFSYENEMVIFANCVRDGLRPTCTPEIGYNSIVPTILGTVAQFDRRYVMIPPGTWA